MDGGIEELEGALTDQRGAHTVSIISTLFSEKQKGVPGLDLPLIHTYIRTTYKIHQMGIWQIYKKFYKMHFLTELKQEYKNKNHWSSN